MDGLSAVSPREPPEAPTSGNGEESKQRRREITEKSREPRGGTGAGLERVAARGSQARAP